MVFDIILQNVVIVNAGTDRPPQAIKEAEGDFDQSEAKSKFLFHD